MTTSGESIAKGIAVVTGASSGIGRCISVELARCGFTICVDHYRDETGANETLQQVREAGGECWACNADVGSADELDQLFAEVKERGQLSVLVNNAAVQTFSPLVELSESDFDRTIRTNLKGTFLCIQRAARLMQDSGGGIVNIGSGANQVPFPSLGDYCASKGGIEMLTKVAAVELGPDVRVNCVAPGAIENERTQAESPDYAKTWGNLAPLARCGQEQDIANAVAFLVSEKASFITGQTIFVDGGLFTKPEWPY